MTMEPMYKAKSLRMKNAAPARKKNTFRSIDFESPANRVARLSPKTAHRQRTLRSVSFHCQVPFARWLAR